MRRRPRKLTPHRFLVACLSVVAQGCSSLRQQALVVGLLGRCTISRQAVHQRLGPAAAEFLRTVLEKLLAQTSSAAPVLGRGFGRVLVQDSTCWSLPRGLSKHFPGPANARGRGASVRVQSLYDLHSERFLGFELSPFTRNDQAASADLLPLLKAGDLVLRDLGYFSLQVFARFRSAGAFFLSRLRYGVSVYEPGSKQPLDLLRRLRSGRSLDLWIELGPQRIPVRLLAFPLPADQVNARRRKARADRDGRLRHSPHYYQLLAWNIFITNAPVSRLSYKLAAQLYRLRWRIETIFKSWKSHLGLRALGPIGRHQVEPLLYALLILAVLMHRSIPRGETLRFDALSLSRLAALFALSIQLLVLSHLPRASLSHTLRKQIHAHCRYETRRRDSYAQLKTRVLG